MSRTENSTKNVISGFICQITVILVGFVVRTVFIRTLGEQFLGINGLFSNFISMLSLTELGIGTSITYKLYKPLADKDTDSICKYMNLYRVLYRIIGVVMLVLGVLMMPIIPHMIKDDTSFFNVYAVFAIYLLQSVSTYLLFAYKSALVKADQKSYIVTNITMAVYIVEYILQIIVLVLFKNFYAYIAIVVIGNVVINLIVSVFVDRRYSYLKKDKKTYPEKSDIKDMFKDCYALSLYKVNGVVLKSVDNIVLSKYIGLAIVGLYSNYLMVYNHLKELVASFYNGIISSLGNLYAEGEKEKTVNVFNQVNYITFILFGILSVGIYAVINPFMKLWIGEKYLLSESFVIMFALEFYIYGILKSISTFRTSMGLFQQGKYRPLLGTVINIALSILLVRKYGISGVLFATLVANISTYFLIDSFIIFKKGFKTSASLPKYFFTNIVNLIVITASAITVKSIIGLFDNAWVEFFVGGVLSVVITFLFMFIVYFRQKDFREAISRITGIMSKVLRKLKRKKNS